MVFTYVYRGWEWVAHDAHVLTEIAFNPDNSFPFPLSNKYYEIIIVDRRQTINKEENFNHAHAQLENIIERAFGVLKARFPILDKMAPYSVDVQRDVVVACFAVHNFIRKERLNDDLYDLYQVIFEEEGEHEQVSDEINGPS
ncbi:uncharacterized protein LOC142177983 [Nicotiana tabacum]|uniref:Uncharacterized protein LOC142177983 n=2 Tax=Nicotiana TaxID=4085 RepID=A0AC58U1J9_TOBAC